MQHAVFIGRDSGVKVSELSYRTLPPRPYANHALGDLIVSHHNSRGAVDFVTNCSARTGGYPRVYSGDRGIFHQLVPVSLARSNGAPALTGRYLVDGLHGATDSSVDENLIETGLQQIPLANTAELEPGDLLGTSP